MAPQSPPSDITNPSRLELPETGATAGSIFDLPYDVADLPGPPPPPPGPVPTRLAQRRRPVVPPTFATPEHRPDGSPAESFALPPAPRAHRSSAPPLPAPLAAGTLSGPALPVGGTGAPDDVDALDDPFVALPPMVAKGEWGDPAGSPGAEQVIDVRTAAGPPSGPTAAPAPAGPATATTTDHGAPGALAFAPAVVEPVRPGADRIAAPSDLPVFTQEPFTAVRPAVESWRRAERASRTRMVDGFLVAAAAASVGGAIWWAATTLIGRPFGYLTLLLGFVIGQCALVGGRRGSVVLGAYTGIFTLASLVVSQYFISRSLEIADAGGDVPLWQGTSFAVEVVRHAFTNDPATAVLVVAAALVAAVQAGIPGRRAAGQLGLPPAPRRSPIA